MVQDDRSIWVAQLSLHKANQHLHRNDHCSSDKAERILKWYVTGNQNKKLYIYQLEQAELPCARYFQLNVIDPQIEKNSNYKV